LTRKIQRQLTLSVSLFTTFFVGTLYLEHVLHDSAVQTGLASMPWFLTLGVLSLGVTSRLTARFGPMAVLVSGMPAAIAGMLLFCTAGVGTAYFPTIALTNFAIGTASASRSCRPAAATAGDQAS
jgi:hypothetical protein